MSYFNEIRNKVELAKKSKIGLISSIIVLLIVVAVAIAIFNLIEDGPKDTSLDENITENNLSNRDIAKSILSDTKVTKDILIDSNITIKSVFQEKNIPENSLLDENLTENNLSDEGNISKYSIKIITQPEDANIKILYLKEEFYQAMKLDEGKYYLIVSKEGYETNSTSFILNEDLTYSMKLKKKTINRYPLMINTIPSDANIEILNSNYNYTYGIILSKGQYEIRVSKDGYETNEIVIDLFENNLYEITLVKKSFKSKMPANASLLETPFGDISWECNDGYYRSDNKCYPIDDNCRECDKGYYLVDGKCTKIELPENASLFDYQVGGIHWICNDGYYKKDDKCYKK